MADRTAPPPVEAVAVATLLDRSPEQLAAVKLTREHGTSLPDQLPGFTRTNATIAFTTKGGWPDTRGMTRYDGPDGTLIAVPHEDGYEIWTVIDHASQIVGLAGGITGLISWARNHRPPRRTDAPPAPPPPPLRERTYDRAGTLVSENPWDGRTLTAPRP